VILIIFHTNIYFLQVFNFIMTSYLKTAIKAVLEASQTAMNYYRSSLEIYIKEDKTPVTAADRDTEMEIIRIIQKDFPDHSFYGEETGISIKSDEFLWIIDPIDGTKNYIAGIPFWGILLALKYQDEIIAGVSYLPVWQEILWAEKNSGTFLNKQKVKVSAIDSISKSMLSFGSLGAFKQKGYDQGISKLINNSARQRSFGDSYPYHLLASGKLEIVAEASIKIVDIAPFDIIIKEAGGMVSDLNGKDINIDTSSFLATNNLIHQDSLSLFMK